VNFLKDVQATFGENLTISAAWLELLPKIDKNAPSLQQFNLVLNAEIAPPEMQVLKELLQRHKLVIDNRNGL
jgi:hypothetical protein